MKNMLSQLYNEGLATTFYKKPLNFIDKKIKNKKVVKLLSYVLKAFYTIFILLIVILYLYRKLK